jgi:hypothetical protein
MNIIRQAYELIIPILVDTDYESICEPLVDCLTVALVKPSADKTTSLTLQPCAGIVGYVPSPAVVIFPLSRSVSLGPSECHHFLQ